MLTGTQISQCAVGVASLQNPVMPLVRLAQMLYLTSTHATFAPLLDELNEPVETNGVFYDDPAGLLREYLDILSIFERCKIPAAPSRIFLNEDMQPLDPYAALDSWVAQEIINRELETINSRLCAPCQCTLCCVGPDQSLNQDFFEIPLLDREIPFFDLSRIDSPESRQATSLAEPPLCLDGDRPFYEKSAALYHWQTGWSMVLPRDSYCPNLDPAGRGCKIYPQRPEVCRRPQIFSYVLERHEEMDQLYEGENLPAFVARKKLLAIWDCPYVRQFQDDIGRYAQLCEIEPVFKKNKE